MNNLTVPQTAEVVKLAHELTSHTLSVWNFYMVVCFALLGYLFSDKGEVLKLRTTRLIFMAGFLAFAFGNHVVLDRAAARHEHTHKLLIEQVQVMEKEELANVQRPLESAQLLSKTLEETAPSPAWTVRGMHAFLTLVVLGLVWFVSERRAVAKPKTKP
ncbi:MAG: hypothetical protein ACK5XN_03575 [Bacteroidota bacterium]|jgi:hypothetical protein